MLQIRDTQFELAVRQSLDRRDWQLVANPDPFALAVSAEAQAKCAPDSAQPTAQIIERAVIHQYCFILYEACADRGSLRQRRAFKELWDHLYRVALFKTHQSNVAQDCTQQALVNIWKHLDQCRDPGSFLNWCNLILLNVVREHFRKHMMQAHPETGAEWMPVETSLDEGGVADPEAQDDPASKTRSSESPPGLENAVRDELHRALVVALHTCLKHNLKETVIIELFLNDKSFAEIAKQMGISVGNVQVLKSRALQVLRECTDFMRVYEEWLT